jgi:prefoldin subunit 5
MLSEEQIKRLVSANESLQVQLGDVNTVLAEREKEIEILKKEIADATELRSKIEAKLAEIESMQERLEKKDQKVIGAEEREFELQQELTEAARQHIKHNELVQQYAYLQSQFEDIRAQLAEVNERNNKLQQMAGGLGELESNLEITVRERDDLKSRLTALESEKYVKEIKL